MSGRVAMIGIVATAIVVLGPAVLQGEPPGLLSLMVLSAVVLAAGLVIRKGGGPTSRRVGSALALLGAVAVIALVVVFQALGRPY